MTKKEVSVEDKLRTLYALQLIDCKIDELRNVRGELPLEVEDLEDEVAGLESRAERLVNDIDKINFYQEKSHRREQRTYQEICRTTKKCSQQP